MWEELFRHSPSIERHRSAALAEERLKYLRRLRDGGFSSSTLRKRAADLLRLVGLLDLTGRRVVSVREVEEAAREWSRPGILRYHRLASARDRVGFVANSVRWLRFLGRLEERGKPPRHPHTAEVAAFAAWARGERGYAEATVESCCEVTDLFFDFLAESNTPLGSVTIVDVDRAIAAKSARAELSRENHREQRQVRLKMPFSGSPKTGAGAGPGIAAAIIVPRIYVNENLPARLKREDVVRLLATTEGDRPVDKRDRAILMLLAVYGLRSGELRGLQLDDMSTGSRRRCAYGVPRRGERTSTPCRGAWVRPSFGISRMSVPRETRPHAVPHPPAAVPAARPSGWWAR